MIGIWNNFDIRCKTLHAIPRTNYTKSQMKTWWKSNSYTFIITYSTNIQCSTCHIYYVAAHHSVLTPQSWFFFCGATVQIGPRKLPCGGFQIAHEHTHPVRLVWTNDQLVAGAAFYRKQQTQARKSPALLSGIGARHPNSRAAEDPGP